MCVKKILVGETKFTSTISMPQMLVVYLIVGIPCFQGKKKKDDYVKRDDVKEKWCSKLLC